MAVAILSSGFVSSGYAGGPERFVGPPSDPWVPNFAHPDVAGGPLVPSVQDGHWSDPGTWGGTIPGAGDVAIVRHDLTFTSGTAYDVVVEAGGQLRFRTDVDTSLEVGTLQVLVGGTLEVGTTAAPVPPGTTAEIVFVDRPIDTSVDPGQYGNGLLVLGTIRLHGAPQGAPFVRLATEPRAGDLQLQLLHSVSGWRKGDRLLLPDTRHVDPRTENGFVSRSEIVALGDSDDQAVSRALQAAVAFDHLGARDLDGNLDFLPHVANLSRNVVLRSAAPSGTRGHVQALFRAYVDMRYALFLDLGRTTAHALDSTIFDGAGNATHIGTNQAGRYPVHAHHLIGPETAQANGYQFTVVGNAIDGGLDEHPFKWGIAVHAAHYGLVADNVLFNYAGSLFVTENGSESNNLIEGNLAVRCSSFGPLNTNDRGTAGTAFWFRGGNNRVRSNVASDARASGFSLNAYRLGNETHMIPAEQGGTSVVPTNMNALPILELADNEAYGPMFFGLDLWEIGSTGELLHETAPSVVRDTRLWHFWRHGSFVYRSHRLTFQDLTIRGDPAWLPNRFVNPVGLDLGSIYRLRNIAVRGADIQGLRVGIQVDLPGLPADAVGNVSSQPSPQDRTAELVIQDSFLRNYFDLSLTSRRDLGSPRRTALCNVDFETVDVGVVDGEPERSIAMSYSFGLDRNVVSPDELWVFNHDGTGDDFQVFFPEQDPSFIVPQTSADGRRIGSPVPGLTNQENWDMFGIAIAGEIPPCLDASTHPNVRGFTCPLDGLVGTTDVSAPTAPSTLRAVDTSSCSGGVQLTWSEACDDFGITGYRVFRDGIEMATVSGASWVDTDVVTGLSYRYVVHAVDGAGNTSEASNASLVAVLGTPVANALFCDGFESGDLAAWSTVVP
ncbi:MAG: hypothetical protein K0U98_09325 [Deltaproteobacteria bacterium]|nr:hypothetical protein [Deltaproteobacteria bacterium]